MDARAPARTPARRDAPPRRARGAGWRRVLGIAFALAGLLLAAYLLRRIFGEYAWSDVRNALVSAPPARIAAAFGFAAASYACLTFFDFLATRYAGFPMPWRRAAHASFTALSLGHNIGFSALSSGAVRYRFYTRWGMSREGVAKVILFCGATVTLGLLALIGLVCLLRPADAAQVTGLSRASVVATGLGALGACGLWLACAAFVRRPLHVRRWSFTFPSSRLAIAQLLVGPLNFAMVAACLHQSIRTVAEADYASVATAYVLANAAALISHVPGGLGVIESVIVWLVPGANLVAALIIFRVAYFIAPFVLGLCVLAVTEIVWRRGATRP